MPVGIFLLIHDEITGPQIKCSYYNEPLTLPQEFVSKLYMSHAGFESGSNLEIKFDHYRIISIFTGNLARKSQKEGILGLIFEENEEFYNLELFLRRNLFLAIDQPNDENIKDIYLKQLLSFLELNRATDKVKIEHISEIFILNGEAEFKTCLLKLGDKKISNQEFSEIYRKNLQNQMMPHYQITELKVDGENKLFFGLKADKPISSIDNIISVIKPYLEKNLDYALELVIMFLYPSIVQILPLKTTLYKKFSAKDKSILHLLNKSKNYREKFDNLIAFLVKKEIYLTPIHIF